ncbi:MAG: multidrug transporter [Candidatus [Bacteroides] periocalifornicus]|uniref:Multidrug transporter n=1 Tax=Candidatus [Bacteroides] periocalifornicus TaxID=1702214 RepID=A0A0Q4B657_9BACT|nr:MAG: multidrug transporter [Candidatus [Bacteroides] periocalifornicus]
MPAADTASLANLNWRELFTDTLLQGWIARGLEQNFDLRTAQLKVEEAQAQLTAARLAFLPSVGATADARISGYTGQAMAKSIGLGANAQWEIDLFGSLLNANRAQRATLEGSMAYRQAVQTQLVASIASSYYSLLMLDAQLAITRKTLENWGASVATMRALYTQGETSNVAVAQAEANRLAAEISALELERQRHRLENSLSVLVGQPPQAIARGSLDAVHFPDTLQVGIPLQLLARRPDVRQAEYALARAFYATNAARSAFYPKLTLTGSAGWIDQLGAAVTNPVGVLLTAVSGLAQPLFNRGKLVANLKVAKAQQQEALLAFQKQLLTAGAEVNNALVQWQTARKGLAIQRQRIERLQNADRGAQLLMQHGNSTYLEVLTAQQALLQAELAEVSGRYNEIAGVIILYHALGGGY